jgi:hypothetical protein
VFNRLCDLEWDTPIGEAASCGGDALMRVTAFRSVGGFKDELIAGEEPEVCLRLRCKGWRVERLDAEMTLHDAAMQRVGQWFRRALRSGHAFAELAFLHGASPERPGVRQTLSNLVWGAVLPLGAVAASFAWGGAVTLLAFGAYGVLTCRVYRAERRRGRPRETAALFSLFCVAGKIPEALGAIKFWSTRVRGLESTLIEYKSA